MLLRISIIHALVFLAGCSTSPELPIQEAYAAQSFRPLGPLYFLPEKAPLELREAALVPDSKIEWDAKMVSKTLGLGGVEVGVSKQVVTLDGVVPTGEAHDTLLKAVRSIHGVSGVRDKLEVRP